MRGEFLDIDGARLYYFAAGTRGAGEPVVFVHGFPSGSHLWHDVIPHVPAGHRVVVLDLLGYGRSDRPLGRDVSIPGHARRVLALLDALRIERACIVGHDAGGGIAQWLAVHRPARVSRLLLVSSVCFEEWPTRDVKLARAMMPLTRHLPPTWLLSVLRTDLLRGYADRDLGARSIEMYARCFASEEGRDTFMQHLTALDSADTAALAPRLGEIVAPTAILWGAHDPFLPPSLARRLQEAIPGATLEVIADGRHFIPEESPEQVGAALSTLLAR
jgi:pimeloyl-ACP methyl ester carboxylesterase